MPISHDLRNIQATLSALLDQPTSNPEMVVMDQDIPFVRVLCANLASLADQVEALEDAPLAFDSYGYDFIPALSPSLSPVPVSALSLSGKLTTNNRAVVSVAPLQ